MSIPQCIGVIIDGNRRWAKQQNLSSYRGHEAGYKKAKEFLKWSKEAGIEHVIGYIFSSENWKRASEEVSYLMDLVVRFFSDDLAELHKEQMRIKVIGDMKKCSQKVRDVIERVQKETEKYTAITFTAAFSYGGRDEIISAANRLLKRSNDFQDKEITADEFSNELWSQGTPDPDLVFRTGGEMRLSNFLLWQCAYSELFFSKTLWPDITKEEFQNVLEEYGRRQRRYGR